ncbi:hypothetical protein [Bergeyella sp. RCAD1439]|uniref:hypothetical protein n=1 Tax=Bergeyella anatis TaxID=3113737 RepID=UPI002E18DDD8|nr:hypothetical protein [Bergeyella sp. RCAD1439]
MRKQILIGLVAASVLGSCGTVSSIVQNTLPYNSNFVVAQGSPAHTTLASVGSGTNLSQMFGASSNVKNITAGTASLTVTSGAQGVGVFKEVKVYLTSGGNEILVAERDRIADNLGGTLSLDVKSGVLDAVMKSGTAVQQRIVYTLKSSPTSDLNVRSSITFSSVPQEK